MRLDNTKTLSLSEITSALLSEHEEERFCSLVLERISEALALDLGFVVKFHDARGSLTAWYPHEVKERVEGSCKVISSCLDLFNEDQYCWIQDIDDLPKSELKSLFNSFDAKSAVVLPVVVGGRRTAALVLAQTQFKRRWRFDDKSFLRVVADQLGVAFGKKHCTFPQAFLGKRGTQEARRDEVQPARQRIARASHSACQRERLHRDDAQGNAGPCFSAPDKGARGRHP
ncbi:MAG: GAF domain-containing protein [Planctomycetota bacterium]|nr:GAF domain-containing protein [Planctomycetota bacterium]